MAGGEILHGTLLANGDAGVLLRGPSGSGKSDLALRLLHLGPHWRLVSDDQVTMSRRGQCVFGLAPASIAGKLEVRGIGIVDIPIQVEAEIRLVVDLVPRKDVPRMPDLTKTVELLGTSVPQARLHGFDASSPLKVAMLLRMTLDRAALRKN